MPSANISITFIQPENGGRKTPPLLTDNYRPHFRVNNGEYLGVAFADDNHSVSFDVATTTQVRFLYHPNVCYDALQAGVEFEVLEGPKLVGYGKVIGLF